MLLSKRIHGIQSGTSRGRTVTWAHLVFDILTGPGSKQEWIGIAQLIFS
jgi:hypothetical protein